MGGFRNLGGVHFHTVPDFGDVAFRAFIAHVGGLAFYANHGHRAGRFIVAKNTGMRRRSHKQQSGGDKGTEAI